MHILNKNITRREGIIVLAVFIALSFVLFGNVIGGEFVYDDNWVIERNPTLKNLGEIPRQFVSSYHYLQPETGLYRPLTLVSYSFNYLLGQNKAFHAVNILLHAANSFLVFLLIWGLFGKRRPAYLSSLLFLFLPIHTEAVSFISGRSDLLAFFFSVASLLLITHKKYWWSAAVFGFALFAKESAAGIVPVIVFMAWFLERGNLRGMLKKLLVYIPAGTVYLILRYIALREHFLANDASYIYNPIKFVGQPERFYTALKVMWLYLGKTFAPLRLSSDYSFNQIPLIDSLWNGYVIAGIVLLLGLAILIIHSCRIRETTSRLFVVGFASLFFLSSYFIISNLIFPIGTIMAERTFYMPSLGVVVAFAFIAAVLMSWKAKKVWLVIFILLMLVYGVVVIKRNQVWLTRESLYLATLKDSPHSAHAKTNLGIYYIQNGRWDDGKPLLEEAYRVAPEHLPLVDSMGIVAEHEGRYGDAEQFYLKAISIRPHYATALSNLGRMYFQLGMYEKSADIYWREFSYHPKPTYLLVYAMSMSKLGRYDEAIGKITEHFGEYPKDIYLQFALGYAYYKKGDKAKANEYFKTSKNPAISDEEFIRGLEKF